MQDPTIEQVMAGIQAHKPTKEQLLDCHDGVRTLCDRHEVS